MSTPSNLKEVYIEELRDLWSANDQMQEILPDLSKHTTNPRLKTMIDKSISGIAKHTQVLMSLVEANGGKVAKDHCKGMEGLVKECKKHALDAKLDDGDVRDVIIISQYHRMSHYGLAGFGVAAAYAKALELGEDEAKLHTAVSDIHQADDAASQLAERAVNLAAKHA